MRPVPKVSLRCCDHHRARLAQYTCPACHQAMVDLGPPAKWSICKRCPYRIAPVQTLCDTSNAFDGNPEGDTFGNALAAE